MKWKAIGKSVEGTSHIESGKSCEDSIIYSLITINFDEEVLLCNVSDGAGSAKFAGEASVFVTTKANEILTAWIKECKEINDASILLLAEILYDELEVKAIEKKVLLNEFSCTFLGCIIYNETAIFFQIGDGAIIREDGGGSYVTVWWPQNGEYSNTTSFLVDDNNLSRIKITIVKESINEVAITTDGLQMLILNYENTNVHHPFFSNLFQWLRVAKTNEDVGILEKKLGEYLMSDKINARTDDDKTLFLATRLKNG